MRISFVAIAITGCYAALPPPGPPHVYGSVTASGGTLGTWHVVPQRGLPVDAPGSVEALDLVDPQAPDHVLRLVRAPAEPEHKGGIEEYMASRGVEVRLATTGEHAAEVVLDRARCATLDVIFRVARGHVFGSARFDCNLGAAGHADGDVEFAAGAMIMSNLSGHVEASDATLANTRFEPDEAETDPRGVVFWDHRHPRVVFEIDEVPTDTSVLGHGSNAKLLITSTSTSVKSFAVAPSVCRVLQLARTESGYVRVGTHQHTSWSGTIAIDCATPGGGRLTGSLELQ